MKLLDLYCGVGGFSLAFENIAEVLRSVDNDLNCKITYDCNFKKRVLQIEMENFLNGYTSGYLVNVDDLVISAGFPCQPFSQAGKRLGLHDKRGNAIEHLTRVLKVTKATALIFENVKGLLSHNNGLTFKVVKKCLKHAGYHIKYAVLNSCTHANIPQNRERLFIVGFRDKSKLNKFEFPEKLELTSNFRDFLDKQPPAKYYYNNKPLYDRIVNSVTSRDHVYQWRRHYIRKNKSGVVPTLTANMGTGGHNVPIILDEYGIRKLTPLECFRLQGFPKTYKLPDRLSDAVLYKQAGNSITVPLVKRIAVNMRDVLNDSA